MALLNSLPNPLVAGAAENIADVTANLEALRASVNAVSAEQINTGAVGSSELATSLYNSLVPLGTVLDWYPPASASAPWTAYVPSGFYPCDGTAWSTITNDLGFSTGNIPDLRGLLISGADPALARGTASANAGVGGTVSTNSRTISESQLPSHNHSVDGSGSHGHAGYTSANGSHTHTFYGPTDFTSASTTQTQATGAVRLTGYSWSQYITSYPVSAVGNDHAHWVTIDNDGSQGAHAHTGGYKGGGTALDVRPASLGLLKIMKVRSAG